MEHFKAYDRELTEWYNCIKAGKIKLPRFQRYEAWDRKRITSLLSVMVNDLPLGITLILRIGDKPQFIDRYIETAPQTENNVNEHLLDGQQRLTAFWRLMQNNYSGETYYVYIPQWDNDKRPPNEDEITGFCQPRWKRDNTLYPVWADDPKICFNKGLLPSNLLKPEPVDSDINSWINKALDIQKPDNNEKDFEKLSDYTFKLEQKEKVQRIITELREIIAHYNLPFLQLNSTVHKETALNVFINMNTNSKPLSTYDIVVAEIESETGESSMSLF